MSSIRCRQLCKTFKQGDEIITGLDHVDLDMVDPNTLRVTLTGTVCGPVLLSFDDGREVELRPRRCRV